MLKCILAKGMEVVSIVTKTGLQEVDVTDSVSDRLVVSKHDQLFQANTNKITSISNSLSKNRVSRGRVNGCLY